MSILPLEPTARRFRLTLLAWAAIVFAAIAPTLNWMEFVNGSENLNVATALEIHRTGRWLLPTLQDEPRIAKPPLTVWTTSGLLCNRTLDSLDSPKPADRAAAYRSLAFQVRWPSLLLTCITLFLVGKLGGLVAGRRIGLLSAVIAGTTVLFLQQSRIATTDVQLWLWVTAANLLIARFLLLGGGFGAAALAGAAIGLAFMGKGPVSLVQTLAPAAAFSAWLAWRRRAAPRLAPALVGIGVMLAVGLAWYALVLLRVPGAMARWREELAGGSPNVPPDAWYKYFGLFAWMLPWTIPFCGGLVLAVRAAFGSDRHEGTEARRHAGVAEASGNSAEALAPVSPHSIPLVPQPPLRASVPSCLRPSSASFALCLLVVPLLIMSFFRDREDRYLLPMLGPASILAAYGLNQFLANWQRPKSLDYVAAIVQWAILATVAVGLPIAGATWLRNIEGETWYSVRDGAIAAAVGAGIVAAGVLAFRRNGDAMLVATAAVLLATNAMFVCGYRDSENGRSEMRPLAEDIRQKLPNAQVYYCYPGRPDKLPPEDLSIYLNRVVIRVNDIKDIPRSDAPQVVTVLQAKGKPEPAEPAGWRYFSSAPRGPDKIIAFVRER